MPPSVDRKIKRPLQPQAMLIVVEYRVVGDKAS